MSEESEQYKILRREIEDARRGRVWAALAIARNPF